MRRIAMSILASFVLAGCTVKPYMFLAPAAAPVQGAEPSLVTAPTADEICQKPKDDSGILVHLYKGNGDSTFRIRPGWTVPIYANWFHAGILFPAPVDPTSVKVTVEPAYWQFMSQPQAHPFYPNGEMFSFGVYPQGEKKPGNPGWITITVEGAKGLDGKDLQVRPISFRLWAYEALKPGESMADCPGIEPKANTDGTTSQGDGVGYASARISEYVRGRIQGAAIDHLTVKDALLSDLEQVKLIGFQNAQPLTVREEEVLFETTLLVEPKAGGDQRVQTYFTVAILESDQWRLASIGLVKP